MKRIIRMMAGVSGPWTAISARHCVPQALSLLLVSLMLAGCSTSNLAILSPASGFATGQRDLIYFAIGLMLIVLIPVWLLAFWFPFRYREREGTRGHHPEWTTLPWVEAVVWTVPAIIVAIIGYTVWLETHRLDPYAPVPSQGTAVQIDAISLDWKWVFLYPDGRGATVNELVLPLGRPIELHLTSDTAMTSLFIPGLAGQIYAMAGMETELNFQPERAGMHIGRNTQYTGGSFPDQQFTVKVVSPEDYRTFLDRLSRNGSSLSEADYYELKMNRHTSPVREYSTYPKELFQSVIDTYCSSNCGRRQTEPGSHAPQGANPEGTAGGKA